VLCTPGAYTSAMATCQRCKEENPQRARFCLACGAALASAVPQARKTVTVVFVDLVGSTDLGERLDPESLTRVMAEYFRCARSALEFHGGTVQKFIGDAVMAVFGVPVLHEDDALRAVRAALELRAQVAELNVELGRDAGMTLRIRIGVNTGEVVVGDPEIGDALVLGDAVNLAARLEQAAAPGEILLGQATWRLVRDGVVAEPLAPLAVKGKQRPVRSWRLQGLRPDSPARLTRAGVPMVGRVGERAVLDRAWARALADQGCRAVTVVGPPGIGKSRMATEALADREREATLLSGRCLPYGRGITFWPLVEVVGRAAHLAETDTPEAAHARLRVLLETEPAGDRVAELVAGAIGLLHVDAAAEEIAWAVRRLLEALAARRPLILVLEDLHWAEPTLLDLVEHLVDQSRHAPILLCCLARPELLEERPAWLQGRVNAELVRLEPLSDAESAELLGHLLGGSLDRPASTLLAQVAEGNPLFLRELVAMLVEERDLQGDTGRGVQAAELAAMPLPPTIHALLAARLDQLATDQQVALSRGAVIGQVFEQRAALALAPAELHDRFPALLHRLVVKELLRRAGSGLAGDEAFQFEHLLLRDVAYDWLPKRLRAELHERFAAWLEEAVGPRRGEYVEILGWHLEQAVGYLTQLGPKTQRSRSLAAAAAGQLATAGRRAFARADMPAAANLLGRAAALLSDSDPERLRLALTHGVALAEAGQQQRALDALAGVAAAATATGDELARWHATLEHSALEWAMHPERWAPADMLRLAERARAAFERLGNDAGLAKAWRLVSDVHALRCQLADAGAAAERALEHARRTGDLREQAESLFAVVTALRHGPTHADTGIRRCAQLLREGLDDPRAATAVLATLAFLEGRRGRFDQARLVLAAAHDRAEDLGVRWLVAMVSWQAGRTETLAGDLAAAERQLRAVDATLAEIGAEGHRVTVACDLARVLTEQGRDQEALQLVEHTREAAGPDDLITQLKWRAVGARTLAAWVAPSALRNSPTKRSASPNRPTRWMRTGKRCSTSPRCCAVPAAPATPRRRSRKPRGCSSAKATAQQPSRPRQRCGTWRARFSMQSA
jgi:class 3 adenylate cyclase